MQLDGVTPELAPDHNASIAATFAEWAQAHRSYGGDYNDSALAAGIDATLAAYRSGLSLTDAFETGRQAYYSALS